MADWTEQAEQMLKTWTEAQKSVWDSWQDFAGRAAGPSTKPQAFSMNPMDWFQQSMSAFADPAGVANDAGRQIFGSQFSMMQNLDMLTKAWRMIAPRVDAGQDWRSGLSDFTSNWFRQLTETPHGLFETTKGTEALLQSYMKEWGPLLQPWIASVIQATGTGHLGEMMLGGSAGLNRLFTMKQGEFGAPPFSGLAEIPSMGIARAHQTKILRAFDAFVDLRRAMLELNKTTIDALNKAVETVMSTLVEKGKKGEKIESVRELNRLWLDSADDVFTKMYASEDYLKVQRHVSKAGMTYKIMQQDVVEMVLKNLNLPTRSELDDAYKTLYELRKEVKSLKKAVREQAKLTGEADPAIAAEAVTPNAIKRVAPKAPAKPAKAKRPPARKKTAARAKSAR